MQIPMFPHSRGRLLSFNNGHSGMRAVSESCLLSRLCPIGERIEATATTPHTEARGVASRADTMAVDNRSSNIAALKRIDSFADARPVEWSGVRGRERQREEGSDAEQSDAKGRSVSPLPLPLHTPLISSSLCPSLVCVLRADVRPSE